MVLKVHPATFGHVQFGAYNGNLWFGYRERLIGPNGYKVYEIESRVPEHIIDQGNEAIYKYSNEQVKEKLAQKQTKANKPAKAKRKPARKSNKEVAVETIYYGIRLKGSIVTSSVRHLSVALKEPFQGHDSINFGWASAITGHFVYDENGNYSPSAIEAAKRVLTWIYDKEKRNDAQRTATNLAQQLNEQTS